jgi:hypothetical protein
MKIKKEINLLASLLLLNSCNSTYINIKSIENSMNANIGKPFKQMKIDKLINETDSYREYETGLGNGCTWSVIVDKETNLIQSWRLTSPRKPCEDGVVSYG